MAKQQHTPEEKAKLALEAIPGKHTINEMASENNIHPNMLSRWKRDAEGSLFRLFQNNSAKERKARKAHDEEIQELYAQIGRLTTQNEWLKKIRSLSCRFLNDACWWTWIPRNCRYPHRHPCSV